MSELLIVTVLTGSLLYVCMVLAVAFVFQFWDYREWESLYGFLHASVLAAALFWAYMEVAA